VIDDPPGCVNVLADNVIASRAFTLPSEEKAAEQCNNETK
jgi:hypothetical protein